MVRGGRSLAALAALGLVAACSGDDGDAGPEPPTTAADRPPATLPDDVDPGRGAMVLDGESSVLTVFACQPEPVTDPATGVTAELSIVAGEGTGRHVDITRTSFTADVPTVTDTVTITDVDDSQIESSRVDAGGRLIDLRVENPVGRLIEAGDDGLVRVEGVFGTPGAAAEPTDVDGALLLRCPERAAG